MFTDFYDDFKRCGWKCMNTLEAAQAGHHSCLVFLMEWGRPCHYRPDKGMIIEDTPQPVQCGTVSICLKQRRLKEYLDGKGFDITTEMVLAMETDNTPIFESLLPKHTEDRFSSVAKAVLQNDRIRLVKRLLKMGWKPDAEIIELAVNNHSRRCLIHLLGLCPPDERLKILKGTVRETAYRMVKEAVVDNDLSLFWALSTSINSSELESIARIAVSHDREWVLVHLQKQGWRPDTSLFHFAVLNLSRRCLINLRATCSTAEQATKLFSLDEEGEGDVLTMLEAAVREAAVRDDDSSLFSALSPSIRNSELNSIARVAITHDRAWTLKHLKTLGWKPGNKLFEAANEYGSKNCMNFMLDLCFPKDATVISAILATAVRFGWLDVLGHISRYCTDEDRDDTTYTFQAASQGHIGVLEFLHKRGWKWDKGVYLASILGNSRPCFRYTKSNDCPLLGKSKHIPRLHSRKVRNKLLKNWKRGYWKKDGYDNKIVVEVMPSSMVMEFASRYYHLFSYKGFRGFLAKQTLAELKHTAPLPFVWEKVEGILSAARPHIWGLLGFPPQTPDDLQDLVWQQLAFQDLKVLYTTAINIKETLLPYRRRADG